MLLVILIKKEYGWFTSKQVRKVKNMKKKDTAREIHKRCGITISGPRFKRELKETIGHKKRFGAFADKSGAAILGAVIRQVMREAGSHVKAADVKKHEDRGVMLKASHFAAALADKNNVIYGIFPTKIAGIYTKTC